MAAASSLARALSGYVDYMTGFAIRSFFQRCMPLSVPGFSAYPDFFALGLVAVVTGKLPSSAITLVQQTAVNTLLYSVPKQTATITQHVQQTSTNTSVYGCSSDCGSKYDSLYDWTRDCADECVSILVTVWVSLTVHITVLGIVLMSVCLY